MSKTSSILVLLTYCQRFCTHRFTTWPFACIGLAAHLVIVEIYVKISTDEVCRCDWVRSRPWKRGCHLVVHNETQNAMSMLCWYCTPHESYGVECWTGCFYISRLLTWNCRSDRKSFRVVCLALASLHYKKWQVTCCWFIPRLWVKPSLGVRYLTTPK